MFTFLLSTGPVWAGTVHAGEGGVSRHSLQVPLHLLPHHLQPHPPAQVAPGRQVCGQTCGADHEPVGRTGRRHGDHEDDEDLQGALVRGGEGMWEEEDIC